MCNAGASGATTGTGTTSATPEPLASASSCGNPLFEGSGTLHGADSFEVAADAARTSASGAGGAATAADAAAGGVGPMALRATAEVAEAEMVSAGRATLPFRICMLVLLRSLDLRAAACHQVHCFCLLLQYLILQLCGGESTVGHFHFPMCICVLLLSQVCFTPANTVRRMCRVCLHRLACMHTPSSHTSDS